MRRPPSPSRGPQSSPTHMVEGTGLSSRPLSFVVSEAQRETEDPAAPYFACFNKHATSLIQCVQSLNTWARLPRLSEMFVEFYNPLTRESETTKLSFIELCLCTGCCIRPHKYIISKPHGNVTRHIIISLSQTIN